MKGIDRREEADRVGSRMRNAKGNWGTAMAMELEFPRMIEVLQTYPPSPQLNFSRLLAEQFEAQGLREKIVPGMRIAVGVGSRGIANLKEIVKATLSLLTAAGAQPFVIPAMGSHGGATPEGQIKILSDYGITAEDLGIPIEGSMEVKKIGTAFNELSVVFSVRALQADGVIAINRVKPHTDFRGTLGSGIQKMLTIGFGKQEGAANAHRAAAHLGYEVVLREFSKIILEHIPVLCGIAILEDQNHQTAEVKVLPPDVIVREENRLLETARSLMPRLPVDEIDLLIVDRIGKEISGTGMDTNIIGRDITGYSTGLGAENAAKPRIHRIFVRELSATTKGNGIGIGLADFTTTRAVKTLDLKSMYMNALTAIGLHPAKIPIQFDTDREAIHSALATLASSSPEKLRVVRIADTLNLKRLLVSQSCISAVSHSPEIIIRGSAQDMQFDAAGNLLPL
jgi:Lactate racemase N-terminal domain